VSARNRQADATSQTCRPIQESVTASLPSRLVLRASGLLLPFGALPFSRLLLRRFDRSVRTTLSNDHVTEAPPPVARVAPPETSIATHALCGASGSRLFELARSARRKKLAAYGVVAGASSMVIGYVWIAASGAPWTAKRQLALAVVCAWPLVPTLAAHLTSRRVVWRAALAHAAVAAGVVVWVGPSILVLLGLSLAADLGILTLFLSKTRTAHSWVVFACMLLFACANVPFFVFQEERAQRWLAELASALGLSSGTAALALCVLAALVAGVLLTWFVARAGASVYHRLRLNSRVLSLLTFWTLYCVAQALVIGARDLAMAALALTALVPIVAALAVAVTATAARHARPPRVLYLRCFDEGAKNATLLSRLELWLSGVAGLDLIAGPDLASTLARPQELLDFVARRGGRAYLKTLAAFDEMRSARDDRVDAEGGVLIRDYFCANAIWKHVFRRLAADADVVVIDARGLRPGESGTAFELTELVHHVPLERVVVVTGELSSARAQLEEAWHSLPTDSPNRSSARAPVQVYAYQDGDDVDVLAMHLLGVIEPGSVARDRSATAPRGDISAPRSPASISRVRL
jgi:hypothetical protein